MVTTAGFGRWPSPLTAAEVSSAKIALSELASDGAALYWLETRPADAGRTVLVRARDDVCRDHSPENVSIRSRVHEYGGGAVCLVAGHGEGAFAYVDQSDQRVWICEEPLGRRPAPPRPLSAAAANGDTQFHGGLTATPDGAWILAVREVHPGNGGWPTRAVVGLSTAPGGPRSSILVAGHDFFGAPRVHPSGDRFAVVCWDHPHMPWDASSIVVVPFPPAFEDHGPPPAAVRTVAGGSPDESVGQPAWRRDGSLRYVSDRRGWWQPYVVQDTPGAPPAQALTDAEAEFHGPDWVLGQSTMAELGDGTVIARMTARGRDTVVALGDEGGVPQEVAQPCVSVSALCAHGDGVALIGSTPGTSATVWSWTAADGVVAIRPVPSSPVGEQDLAVGEPFTVPTRSGRPVHGTLYRPALAAISGPEEQRPPLVVWCHGGPTSASGSGLDLALQYFTTRGFAVACVDYAGSSGYGRAYRDALRGLWGVADSEDCRVAARHLASRGDVDPARMAVRGSSAGGMTALNALATGEEFGACASWYGVTDLMGLAASTHDFEAHYTDGLIGPLPEARARYEARSPANRARQMRGSVLLLQGTEDPVVPPSQAERLRDALRAADVPCDLHFFEGEGHGFRRVETLTASLEHELALYCSALGL